MWRCAKIDKYEVCMRTARFMKALLMKFTTTKNEQIYVKGLGIQFYGKETYLGKRIF